MWLLSIAMDKIKHGCWTHIQNLIVPYLSDILLLYLPYWILVTHFFEKQKQKHKHTQSPLDSIFFLLFLVVSNLLLNIFNVEVRRIS